MLTIYKIEPKNIFDKTRFGKFDLTKHVREKRYFNDNTSLNSPLF